MMKWKHQKDDTATDCDVARSIAVLDRVLSEFDDIESDFSTNDETIQLANCVDKAEWTRSAHSEVEHCLSGGLSDRRPATGEHGSSTCADKNNQESQRQPSSEYVSTASNQTDAPVKAREEITKTPDRVQVTITACKSENDRNTAKRRYQGLVQNYISKVESKISESNCRSNISAKSGNCNHTPDKTNSTPSRNKFSPAKRSNSAATANSLIASRQASLRSLGMFQCDTAARKSVVGEKKSVATAATGSRCSTGDKRPCWSSGKAPPTPSAFPVLPPLPIKAVQRQMSSPQINFNPPKMQLIDKLKNSEALQNGKQKLDRSESVEKNSQSKIASIRSDQRKNSFVQKRSVSSVNLSFNSQNDRKKSVAPELLNGKPTGIRSEVRKKSAAPPPPSVAHVKLDHLQADALLKSNKRSDNTNSTSSSSSTASPTISPVRTSVDKTRDLFSIRSSSSDSSTVGAETRDDGSARSVCQAPQLPQKTRTGSQHPPAEHGTLSLQERRPHQRKKKRQQNTSQPANFKPSAIAPPDSDLTFALCRRQSTTPADSSAFTPPKTSITTCGANSVTSSLFNNSNRKIPTTPANEFGHRISLHQSANPRNNCAAQTVPAAAAATFLPPCLSDPVPSHASVNNKCQTKVICDVVSDIPSASVQLQTAARRLSQNSSGYSSTSLLSAEHILDSRHTSHMNGVQRSSDFNSDSSVEVTSEKAISSSKTSSSVSGTALQKPLFFSPIVKDRLNDSSNMYIPAPLSPRPDYYDSELSETDSLVGRCSDNENLLKHSRKAAKLINESNCEQNVNERIGKGLSAHIQKKSRAKEIDCTTAKETKTDARCKQQRRSHRNETPIKDSQRNEIDLCAVRQDSVGFSPMISARDSHTSSLLKTPLDAMIENFHRNLPPPPPPPAGFEDSCGPLTADDNMNNGEIIVEPDDSYYSDDSLDVIGEDPRKSSRRRRRKSDWMTTSSFDFIHHKEVRKRNQVKSNVRDEGISSLESHNSASDDNERARRRSLSIENLTPKNYKDKFIDDKNTDKFNSIRKLIKEGKIEGLCSPPPTFTPPPPPNRQSPSFEIRLERKKSCQIRKTDSFSHRTAEIGNEQMFAPRRSQSQAHLNISRFNLDSQTEKKRQIENRIKDNSRSNSKSIQRSVSSFTELSGYENPSFRNEYGGGNMCSERLQQRHCARDMTSRARPSRRPNEGYRANALYHLQPSNLLLPLDANVPLLLSTSQRRSADQASRRAPCSLPILIHNEKKLAVANSMKRAPMISASESTNSLPLNRRLSNTEYTANALDGKFRSPSCYKLSFKSKEKDGVDIRGKLSVLKGLWRRKQYVVHKT